MSWKAEILPKAHDEKNARRGYQLLGDRPVQIPPIAKHVAESAV
jgi:hypothetical protein